jgi:phosphoribosyl-AMP cyclohydrolase
MSGLRSAGFPLYRAAMSDARDTGFTLDPRYDAQGLITAVVTDDVTGEVLMLAHMNAQALALTVETGLAHFWSRSRQALWKKGETSGNMLAVRDIRIDCDQDAVWIKAVAAGPACHTGARSCFYRRIGPDGLSPVDAGDDAAA